MFILNRSLKIDIFDKTYSIYYSMYICSK